MLPGAAWSVCLLAVLCILAFWRSLWQLVPLLGVDTAEGLAPAVPLLAVWMAAASARNRALAGQRQAGERDAVIDGGIAALCLAIAASLIWRSPVQDGWFFWANRLDLLALPLFAVGTATILWGAQTVFWHRGAVLYSLLIWPLPLLRLQDVLAQPLAALTALAARPLALLLGVRLLPVGGDPSVFASAGAQQWTIIIGDVCSGLNAALAVALVCVPAAVQLDLPWRRAAWWAGAGVLLALVGNVVRVVVLLVVAARAGAPFALGRVHPLVGGAILLAIFVLLWLVAPHSRHTARRVVFVGSASGAPARRTVALAVVLSGLFAAGSARLGAFELLPPVGPPGGAVDEALAYLRLPAGWTIEDGAPMSWYNLFGPESYSYALNVSAASGALVKVQFVTTPDQRRLDRFGLEACRVYHGDAVVGRRRVDLGAGASAQLVDTLDQTPLTGAGRLSVLYWQAPFMLGERRYNARVALFLVQGDEASIGTPAVPGVAPGGTAFDRADTVLIDLARGITEQVLLQPRTLS